MIKPELPTDPIKRVEIEAVFSKANPIVAWREMQNKRVATVLGLMVVEWGVMDGLCLGRRRHERLWPENGADHQDAPLRRGAQTGPTVPGCLDLSRHFG